MGRKKSGKRFWAVFLSVVICMSMLPSVAWAADDSGGGEGGGDQPSLVSRILWFGNYNGSVLSTNPYHTVMKEGATQYTNEDHKPVFGNRYYLYDEAVNETDNIANVWKNQAPALNIRVASGTFHFAYYTCGSEKCHYEFEGPAFGFLTEQHEFNENGECKCGLVHRRKITVENKLVTGCKEPSNWVGEKTTYVLDYGNGGEYSVSPERFSGCEAIKTEGTESGTATTNQTITYTYCNHEYKYESVDDSTHQYICKCCNKVISTGNHDHNGKSNRSLSVCEYVCSGCGYKKTYVKHDFETYNITGKDGSTIVMKVCKNCGLETDDSNHEWETGKPIQISKPQDQSSSESDSKSDDNSGGTAKTEEKTVTEKSTNTLSVKAKSIIINAADIKKKTRKYDSEKIMTLTKAQGTVIYKLKSVTKSKYKKYFKVNAKTGKLTVKKKLKKGSYKVTISVTAIGNDSYKPITKMVTVKVKVN